MYLGRETPTNGFGSIFLLPGQGVFGRSQLPLSIHTHIVGTVWYGIYNPLLSITILTHQGMDSCLGGESSLLSLE